MLKTLPRRTVLRGLGVCLGLPLLEAMIPRRAYAAGPAPQRFGAFYFANGVIQNGPPGSQFNYWGCTPGSSPRDFALSRTLSGLAAFKQDLVVIDGLFNSTLYTAGGGGAHWASTTGFLAGQAYVPSGVRLPNPGRSLDQELAGKLAGPTRLASLVMGARPTNNPPPGDSRGSGAYFNHVSWRAGTEFAFRHATSVSVFDALVGAAPPTTVDPLAEVRRAAAKSVLDYVKGDAQTLSRKLGASDRQRLESFLSGIRELEKQIANEGTGVGPACTTPARDVFTSESYARRAQNMMDLWVLAFQCDLTRVVTFMLETEHNYNPLSESAGVAGAHHDVSHYRMNDALDRMIAVNAWQVGRLAYLLGKLKSVMDVDGRTLLDNSLILYGTGCGDGDSHTASNTPAVLAGRGAGLDTGRLYRANGARYANLLLTLGQKFGLTIGSFGDSNGALVGL